MSRQRKTRDVWEVRADYGYGDGFECVCASLSRREALRDLRDHRENERGAAFKLVKTRERIAPECTP